jgi:hypothetical protein
MLSRSLFNTVSMAAFCYAKTLISDENIIFRFSPFLIYIRFFFFSGTQLERKTTVGYAVIEVNDQYPASSALRPAVIGQESG